MQVRQWPYRALVSGLPRSPNDAGLSYLCSANTVKCQWWRIGSIWPPTNGHAQMPEISIFLYVEISAIWYFSDLHTDYHQHNINISTYTLLHYQTQHTCYYHIGQVKLLQSFIPIPRHHPLNTVNSRRQPWCRRKWITRLSRQGWGVQRTGEAMRVLQATTLSAVFVFLIRLLQRPWLTWSVKRSNGKMRGNGYVVISFYWML